MGDKLQIPMPKHLLKSALTAFQGHPLDLRVLDLVHRIRRLSRKVLGIAQDTDRDNLVLDALRRLPRRQDSYEYNGRVLKCNRIRNLIIHQDYHATAEDLAHVEVVWEEFKERAASFFGMASPAGTLQPANPDWFERSDRVEGAPTRNSWSEVIEYAVHDNMEGAKRALMGLIESYESSIVGVFQRLSNLDSGQVKTRSDAFRDFIQSQFSLDSAREFKHFRSFLAREILRFTPSHSDNSASGTAHRSQESQPPETIRQTVEQWLTARRAAQLCCEALTDAAESCEGHDHLNDVTKMLQGLRAGTLSWGKLSLSGAVESQTLDRFIRALRARIQDEIHLTSPEALTNCIDAEISALYDVITAGD